ncbi:MAG: transcriptional regulator [Gammaproteobacteria bacterium]|nr:MAG: transcriptional regulator [Gammaproteobacteria bacterium]
MRNNVFIASLFTLWMSVSVAVPAQADHSEAHQWLDRMSHALRETAYDGVFVYEQGDHMHSLRIVHAVKDGVEHERLVHMDGEPREIIRKGHEITCVHPGDEKVRLDHAVPAGAFAQRFFGESVSNLKAYAADMGKPVRVAGHDAVTVVLTPQDEWRYGHRLALEQSSGLLLRSELVDVAGHVLERFQFTSLSLGDVPEAALQPSAKGHAVPHHMPAPAAADTVPAHWKLAWVPAEFTMAMSDVSRNAGDKSGVQMYTDGLVGFSVFVETASAEQPEVVMQHGATVVYSRTMPLGGTGLHTVTVVGEIPVLAARKLAASVQAVETPNVQ